MARIGCRTSWLSHELVVEHDGCREELVVARNWWSRGIGCLSSVVARNWLSHGIGCPTELVFARNWLSHGIGCRTEMIVARK